MRLFDAVRRHGKASLALAALALLAGCSGPSETELLSSARKHLAESAPRGAMIELKTVLQHNPQSVQARLMMGEALTQLGDLPGALVEYTKALDAGADPDEVVPPLARTQLRLFRFKEIVDRHAAQELKSPIAAADLKGSLAAAYLFLGDSPRAAASAEAAVKLDPKTAGARIVQARMMAAKGEFDAALQKVAAVLADVPNATDASQLQGDLLWLAKGDLAKAVASYEATLKADPRHLPAHAALTMLELSRNDVPAFRKRVGDMKKIFPNALDTRIHEVELALLDKDLKRAREGVQQLLRAAPESDRILQLAGVIELAAGSPAQALAHLQKAVTRNPRLALARRLLAETHIRVGDSDRALAVLEPLLAQSNPGLETLQLAAEAHLQRGDLASAERAFAAAAAVKPDDASVGTALALTMIAKGRPDAGFARLAELSRGSASTTADLALISARMRRSEWEQALAAVEDLRRKQPDKALPWLLKGRILVGKRDMQGARESLEQALKVEPKFFPAAMELAALEASPSRPEAAEERYRAFLANDPKNANGLMALAFERKRRNAPAEEVTKLLQEAAAAAPEDPSPRLALVEHYLSLSRADEALALAQENAARFPDNLDVIDSLGRTQVAKGDLQQAMSSFGKVAAARPLSALAQLRLAEVERRQRNFETALERVSAALMLAPDLPAAQSALLTLAFRDGKSDAALRVTRDLQKKRPTLAAGFALEGALHASKTRWPQAISAFEAALQRSPTSSDLAMRLHAIYLKAGKTSEAQRLATRWEAANPRDAAFSAHLGVLALTEHDYPRAEAKLRTALELQPDDPRLMNNLAWALLQQKKPGALPLAEKANQLLPNVPIFLDTLAHALAEAGQSERALALQRRAIELAPDDYTMRLHLARILVKTGDKASARTELEKLSKLGDRFDGQGEVNALLKAL